MGRTCFCCLPAHDDADPAQVARGKPAWVKAKVKMFYPNYPEEKSTRKLMPVPTFTTADQTSDQEDLRYQGRFLRR
jgi:hypothetical protein